MLKYDVMIPNQEHSSHYVDDIREFLAQDQYDVAECIVLPDITSKTARNNYYSAIKRLKYPVKVAIRRDRVFLIKK